MLYRRFTITCLILFEIRPSSVQGQSSVACAASLHAAQKPVNLRTRPAQKLTMIL